MCRLRGELQLDVSRQYYGAGHETGETGLPSCEDNSECLGQSHQDIEKVWRVPGSSIDTVLSKYCDNTAPESAESILERTSA